MVSPAAASTSNDDDDNTLCGDAVYNTKLYCLYCCV